MGPLSGELLFKLLVSTDLGQLTHLKDIYSKIKALIFTFVAFYWHYYSVFKLCFVEERTFSSCL